MNNLKDKPQKLILVEALDIAKTGDLMQSRKMIGLTSNKISDEDFKQSMIALDKGFELLRQNQHSEAWSYFNKAQSVLNYSENKEILLHINTLTLLTEGIMKLFKGDAFGAVKLLNISNDMIDQLGFRHPWLKKMALSFKAAGFIAVARTYMNAADVNTAELWLSKATSQYEILLSQLDPSEESDAPAFFEIYLSKVEFSILFAILDQQVFAIDDMRRRLLSADDAFNKARYYVEKIKPDPIQKVGKSQLITYEALVKICQLEKELIVNPRPLTKEGLKTLTDFNDDLFKAKELAQEAGDRGAGVVFYVNMLTKVRSNLLFIGKVDKSDFGKFSGIITFVSLIILIIIVHLTIRPEGANAAFLFLGEMIISLIVGFGFGALKFIPLIKLYSNAIKQEKA